MLGVKKYKSYILGIINNVNFNQTLLLMMIIPNKGFNLKI